MSVLQKILLVFLCGTWLVNRFCFANNYIILIVSNISSNYCKYREMHFLCSGGRHFKLRLGKFGRLKNNLLHTEIDFWRRAPRTSRVLKVRNKIIREKIGVIQTILEIMENSALKWYGHVVCMEDKRWPKQIITLSPRRIQLSWPEVGYGSGEGYEAE